MLQIAGQKSKRLARFHRRPGENDAIDLLFLQGRNRHRDGEICFARARRADPEDDVMFLDRLEIIALAKRAGDNRRLARRGDDLGRDKVIQVVGARFVHGIEGVVEFVALDIDAALPRVFELSEDLLGFRDLRRFAFQL